MDYELDHQLACYTFCFCGYQHACCLIAHVSRAVRLPHSLKTGEIKFSKQQGCQVSLTELTQQSIIKWLWKSLSKTCWVLSHIFSWLCSCRTFFTFDFMLKSACFVWLFAWPFKNVPCKTLVWIECIFITYLQTHNK